MTEKGITEVSLYYLIQLYRMCRDTTSPYDYPKVIDKCNKRILYLQKEYAERFGKQSNYYGA